MLMKRKITYAICMYMLLMSFVLCGSGCGNKSVQGELSTEQEQLIEYDLASERWMEYPKIEKADNQWVVTEYLDSLVRDIDIGKKKGDCFSAVCDDVYYCIQHSYTIKDTQVTYEYDMYYVNTTNLKTETVNLSFQCSGESSESEVVNAENMKEKIEQGLARIVDVDATKSTVCILVGVWDKEWCLTNCYVVEMNFAGEITRIVDMGHVPLCKGTHSDTLGLKVVSDEKYFYLLDIENAKIIVTDKDGSVKTEVEVQDCEDLSLCATCKSESGIPIFEYRNNAGNTVIFALHGEVRKELYCGDGESVSARYADAYGRNYYLNSKHLLCWDVVRGVCKSLYDIDGMGFTECSEIMMNSLGEIVLLFETAGEVSIYKLKDNDDIGQTEIEILLLFDDEYTKICAAEYSRTHPGITINVSNVQANEMTINRTAEDMKAGNGPDMILLNRAQLLDMESAGCLLPLTKVLPQELQEQMFKGAIQYGTIKEELYGIAYEASIGCLLVADATWEKETWTLQEVLDLLKEKEKNGTMPERFASIYYSATAEQLLYDLCVQDIENSSFLEIQDKRCNFESEEFCSLLRLCNAMGEEDSQDYISSLERQEQVLNGNALTYYVGGGLIEFTNARELFGEGFHCVGYPTNSGNSGLVHCYRCIAVNKWTENADIINDFIQFMLSEENQVKYTTYWVRRDIILNNVYENTELAEGPVFMMDGYSYTELGSNDGSAAYVNEYIELMNNSNLLSTEYEIQNIVMEEAQRYFAGDKTEKEVAAVIQSRVQLYLEENK